MPWDDDLSGPALDFAAAREQRIRGLAGPGTGKTFALMKRVERLLEEGIPPERILVVTLTRTAADDLRQHLQRVGVNGTAEVHACTLHSLCFSLLLQDQVLRMTGRAARLLMNFERDILLKDLPDRLGTFSEKKALLGKHDAAWAGLDGNPLGAPPSGLPRDFQTATVDNLAWHQAMLVGELVPLAYAYLSQNPYAPILVSYDHILVDEYQDLNRADQAVIDLLCESSLAQNRGQLAVVGDEDQSIYVLLRCAHPRGIADFPADRDVLFTECRRCPRLVVQIAQHLIEHNPGRIRGPLLPCSGSQEGKIHNVVFETMEEEAVKIAEFVHHRITSGRVNAGDVLILANWREIAYRIRDQLVALGTNAHSYFSEQALDHADAQRELTLLSLLADLSDRVALRAWLALSDTSQNRACYRRILDFAVEHQLTASEVLQGLADNSVAIPYCTPAVAAWNQLQGHLLSLQPIANDISGLVDRLLPENVEGVALLREAARRAMASTHEPQDVRTFVHELRRQVGMPEVPLQAPFVRLMSLHKSKGLSAKLVVIAGLVNGLIPRRPAGHLNNEQRQEQYKEQRRVLFVGVTRTEEILVLSKFQQIESRACHISGVVPGRWVGRGIRTTMASPFLPEFGPNLPPAIRGDQWRYD